LTTTHRDWHKGTVAIKKSTRKAAAPAAKRAAPKRAAGAKRSPRPAAAKRSPPASAPLGAPLRAPRRAIFIDVENTSSEEALAEVLAGLNIDRAAQPTELTAVGNWRAAGQRLGRQLASLGAQLVHSAPAPGVRDWSDLWIAVAAGCWLGQSAPGDILDIISNDRAFDAVGDAAAARGVIYRRLLHRRGGTASSTAIEKPAGASRRSRGGRRRRGRKHTESAAAPLATPPPAPTARTSAPLEGGEPHGASREQMLGLIRRLTNGDSGRWVNLDVLEKALKAEGFSRPPGSPRLVTRLRMLKEVEVDSHGRVRLTPGDNAHPRAPEMGAVPRSAPPDAPPAPKRRRRRRSKVAAVQPDLPASGETQD
jgi:hypothetical protein